MIFKAGEEVLIFLYFASLLILKKTSVFGQIYSLSNVQQEFRMYFFLIFY